MEINFDDYQGTVNAHYGMSADMFNKLSRAFLVKMIIKDKVSDIVDEAFSNLSEVDRAAVVAFAEAWHRKKGLKA